MCWCDPQKRTPWCDNCWTVRPDLAPEYERQQQIAKERGAAISEFEDRVLSSLECEMCGEKRSAFDDASDVSKRAYEEGWRFQNGQVLCQYCTDNKR